MGVLEKRKVQRKQSGVQWGTWAPSVAKPLPEPAAPCAVHLWPPEGPGGLFLGPVLLSATGKADVAAN